MKVEIQCGSCSQCFLLDADLDGVQLVCPACSAPMQVSIDRPATPRPAPSAPEPQVVVPAAAANTFPVPTKSPALPAAPVATAPPDEVVCPRCNLHFRPRADSAPNAGRAGEKMPTVLVVEDMGYFREIATDALKEAYTVKTAATVDEARAYLQAGGVDLMVLDLTLDGGEFGIDLLREFPHKPCPILIYTAQDESEMYGAGWEELQSLGADDIVMKGLNVGESLLRKVGSLLGREEEDLVEGAPPH